MGVSWTPFGGNATRRVLPAGQVNALEASVPPANFDAWLTERTPSMQRPAIEGIPARPGILEILRNAVQSSAAETRKFAEYFPVIGDVIQGIDALSAAQGGRYGEAALLGGAAMLPGAIGSIRKSDPLGWFLQSKINPANTTQAFEETKRNLQELIRADARTPHPLEGKVRKFDLQHSTSAFFSQPELRRVERSTGMGDQWQGQGALYATESPAVTAFYRDQTGSKVPQLTVDLPHLRVKFDVGALKARLLQQRDDYRKSLFDIEDPVEAKQVQAKIAELQSTINMVNKSTGNEMDPFTSRNLLNKMLPTLRAQYVDNLAKAEKLRETITPEMRQEFETLINARRVAMEQGGYFPFTERARELSDLIQSATHAQQTARETLQLYNNVQRMATEGRRISRGTVPLQNTYEIDFFANPDELYNLGRPIDQQKAAQRLVAGLNEFTVPSGAPAGGTPLGDHLAWMQSRYPRVMGRDKIYDLNEVILGNNPHNQFTALRPTLTDADQWQVMEALRSKGIVGNRYLTRFAAENPTTPQHSNFVITEPSRAKFVDLWSILPFAAAGAATAGAMNREQQPRVYNTNPQRAARRPGT